MATATNRQNFFNAVFSLLKKHYDPLPEPERRPVLEQLLYAVCREGATREPADRAFGRLKERFFDWNEVRVSSVHEVEDALEGLPGAYRRAQRILAVLGEIFEVTFSYDMEDLAKKGLKEAAKKLERLPEVNDYVVAWVVQQALGGHAVPLDAPTLRVLKRLHAVDGDGLEAARGTVEHYVPKTKGPAFIEMMSRLAQDVCWEDVPNCPACPLKGECPTGQERLRAAGEARPRLKSR